MLEKIYIYHTNDLHSHFENWPRIRKELQRRREIHEQRGESMFLFDVGDHVDRFHPYSEGTMGKGNVKLLNECGYDGVTIGNNEGITLSHEDLMELYREARFDCLVANLFFEDGSRPPWAKPYRLYETRRGTKIGVIGVTINYSNFYRPLHWVAGDPFAVLRKWLPFLKEQADLIVVLSHLGLSEDERIAQEFPEVDVVLGAHTHHVLERGKEIGQTLLCCTGKYGMNIGRVELAFDPEKRKPVRKRAMLIATEGLAEAEGEKRFVEQLEEDGKKLLSAPVAKLPARLKSDWFRETELNRLLCKALTEWCEAECAFINAGILLDDLPEGIVTEYDIHRICPHPINPCTVSMKGGALKEVLAQMAEDPYLTLALKGFGFRGEIFGKMIFDNIQISGKGASAEIRINGAEIEPERRYTVATLDMLAIARFYPPIMRAEKRFFLPEFIRDVLKWKLRTMFPLPEDD